MKKLSVLLLCSLILFGLNSFGQNAGGVSIGKGDQPANPKSILELVSQTKGLLIPRMTTEQRNAIFTEADLTTSGLLVYDSSLNSFFYWNGGSWKDLASMDNTVVGMELEGARNLNIKEGSRTITVDLSSLKNVVRRFEGAPSTPGLDSQLAYDAVNDALYIFKTDKWVLLNAITDKQKLSTNGTQLIIENGNTIDLLPILGKTPMGVATPDIANSKEGDTFLNTTNHRLYFFDGTTWKIINQGSIDNLARTIVSGATNPTIGNSIGDIFYNITESKLYSFDGVSWKAVGDDTDDQTLAEILGVNTSAGNRKITNLADPTGLQDAVTKNYVDLTVSAGTADASTTTKGKVQLAGDLSGTADVPVIGANKITTAKIAESSVTYLKIQHTTSSNVVLGRATAGGGVVEEIATIGTGNVVRADSPTFIGTPSLPTGTIAVTQPAADNSTKVATTAFVNTAVNATSAKKWTNITSLTYTLAVDDYYLLNVVPAATPGPVVITLPVATTALQGREFCVLNNNGTQIISFSIEPVGAVKTVAAGRSAKFICTGTYWFCVSGD